MTMPRPNRGGARLRPWGFPSTARCRARAWRKLTGAPAVFVLVGVTLPAPAQSPDSNEYRLKLAFLYNFAQFVEWPPEAFRDPAAPLAICVVGDDPFQGEMAESLRGRAVRGHPLELRRLHPDEDPRTCQMIFVRATEKKEIPRILAISKGDDILLVGEAEGFAKHGGMINLTREENRLRFEINIGAAAQTHLKISSKLLALAKIVTE
jgi:hypothetical protein